MTKNNLRDQQLFDWVKQQLKITESEPVGIELVSGDASFRRYFRVEYKNNNYIAVDAPVETENTLLFVELANTLKQANIAASEVIAADFESGFMLQPDLGNIHLADQINDSNFQSCYRALWPTLDKLQSISKSSLTSIDSYKDSFVQLELGIFDEWFIEQYLNYSMSADEKAMLEQSKAFLTQQFLAQPQVAVHRDFHSKNIMLKAGDINQPVLIDFQGMLIGPVCYDLVSLLKDCYLIWPGDTVNRLSEEFRALYYPQIETRQWQDWFDLAGLQRHIKCAGIFARLAIRDNKPDYLQHIPAVLNYIVSAAAHFAELKAFLNWLEQKILPLYSARQTKGVEHV